MLPHPWRNVPNQICYCNENTWGKNTAWIFLSLYNLFPLCPAHFYNSNNDFIIKVDPETKRSSFIGSPQRHYLGITFNYEVQWCTEMMRSTGQWGHPFWGWSFGYSKCDTKGGNLSLLLYRREFYLFVIHPKTSDLKMSVIVLDRNKKSWEIKPAFLYFTRIIITMYITVTFSYWSPCSSPEVWFRARVQCLFNPGRVICSAKIPGTFSRDKE